MNRMWKVGLAIVAVIVLAGTAIGFVAAQTDSDPARPFSNFLSRLAENLGITEAELNEAIDQTSVDIVDEKEIAGDLTSEQADRIRERIASGEGRPFFGGFGHGFGKGFGGFGGHGFGKGFGHLGAGLDDLAACLGVATADDLRTAFTDGQSLAQIGADHGKSRDDVKACITSPLQERLDQAVADGKIDQAKADEITQRLTERLDDHIDGTGMGGFHFGKGDHSSLPWSGLSHSWGMPSSTELASTTY